MNLADDAAPPMSGLEQIRALMRTGRRPGIAEALDFQLVEIDDGRAVFEGVPGVHAYNPIGTVHGGYAATLLDSACGMAVHSKLDAEQGYTTLELKVAYHRALTSDTGLVRAEGRVMSFGRRAALRKQASSTVRDGSARRPPQPCS